MAAAAADEKVEEIPPLQPLSRNRYVTCDLNLRLCPHESGDDSVICYVCWCSNMRVMRLPPTGHASSCCLCAVFHKNESANCSIRYHILLFSLYDFTWKPKEMERLRWKKKETELCRRRSSWGSWGGVDSKDDTLIGLGRYPNRELSSWSSLCHLRR
jgi:hypothetical protein